jgi:hypothetical protein
VKVGCMGKDGNEEAKGALGPWVRAAVAVDDGDLGEGGGWRGRLQLRTGCHLEGKLIWWICSC